MILRLLSGWTFSKNDGDFGLLMYLVVYCDRYIIQSYTLKWYILRGH